MNDLTEIESFSTKNIKPLDTPEEFNPKNFTFFKKPTYYDISEMKLEGLKKYAEIEAQEEENEKDYEDRLVEELATHGKQDNISFFAFTATPKAKTLELFGTKQENGSFTPYHVYSMRQAIEEGKKLCGVCGGIAEYFNIDPTVVRLLWMFLVLCAGTGILAYFVAAIIMPYKSEI